MGLLKTLLLGCKAVSQTLEGPPPPFSIGTLFGPTLLSSTMILPHHQRPNRNVAFEEDRNASSSSHSVSHPVTDSLEDSNAIASAVPLHPLGIKPLGNKYFFNGNDARNYLGNLQALPDEMLMQLFEYLDPRTLRLLGYTCKFLFACCMSDDIWKTIFLE